MCNNFSHTHIYFCDNYLTSYHSKMSYSNIIITPRVIETIQRLPVNERRAISMALANDIFLGLDPQDSLSPYQTIIYTLIRDYVTRATLRQNIDETTLES